MDELDELKARRAICLYCIRAVSEVDAANPLRAGAIAEYNRQLSEIDKKITAITGAIPPIVIGLKTAQLTAKAH